MKNFVLATLLLGFGILAGCASVPMASNELDQQAKQFKPAPGKANIYVYRNEVMGSAIKMEVDLDSKRVGATASKTYLVLPVNPGRHVVVSHAENSSKVVLEAESGKNYFLWQEVKMGFLSARTELQLKNNQDGREGVLECRLIQTTLVHATKQTLDSQRENTPELSKKPKVESRSFDPNVDCDLPEHLAPAYCQKL